jgi:hypothetical protein
MTNTVFPTFQTQYPILDFSSASRSGTLGFAKHRDFPVYRCRFSTSIFYKVTKKRATATFIKHIGTGTLERSVFS